MAVVLPGGNYVGGGRSRTPDMSGMVDAAREWNIRMDVPQQQRLEQYGLPGLAYLATTGDQQARRFLDRYYGRGNWEKYTPSTTYDEEGNPTLVPPSGVPWDKNQQSRMGTDLFGFDFIEEEEAVEPESAPSERSGVGAGLGGFKPGARPGERPSTPEPEPEVAPEPEAEPAPSSRSGEPELNEGDRYPEYLEVFHGETESLGKRGSFQDRPANADEAVRYLVRSKVESYANEGQYVNPQLMSSIVERAVKVANDNPNFPEGVDPNLVRELEPYGHQFNVVPATEDRTGPPPVTEEDAAWNVEQERYRRSGGDAQAPVGPGDGIQAPPGMYEGVEGLEGTFGPQSAVPGAQPSVGGEAAQISEPEFVARVANVGSDAGIRLFETQDGENIPIGIERGTDPQTGRPLEGFRIGKDIVPIANPKLRVTAEQVRDYLASPKDSNRHKGTQAALEQTVKQAAPAFRETVNTNVKSRMVPRETFARQVDAYIRSDPEGASMYFTEAAQMFMEARNIEARTALASEQARRTRMETDALEALGGSEFMAEQTRLQNEALKLANDKAKLELRRAGLMLGVEEDLQKSADYFTRLFENKLHMSNAEAMAASLEMTQGRFIQAFFNMFDDPQAMQQMGQQLAGFGEDPYKAFGMLLQIMNLDSVKENTDLQTDLFNIPLGSLFGLKATPQERSGFQSLLDSLFNRTPPRTLGPADGVESGPDPDRGQDEAYEWSRESDLGRP